MNENQKQMEQQQRMMLEQATATFPQRLEQALTTPQAQQPPSLLQQLLQKWQEGVRTQYPEPTPSQGGPPRRGIW